MRFLSVLIISSTLMVAQSFSGFTQGINRVVDEKNKLMWQDNADVMEYFETYISSEVYCDVLVLSGYTNWRVPTISELQSIVDLERKNALVQEFDFVRPTLYRTQSLFKDDTDLIWVVDFATGKTDTVNKKEKHLIRCVRDM